MSEARLVPYSMGDYLRESLWNLFPGPPKYWLVDPEPDSFMKLLDLLPDEEKGSGFMDVFGRLKFDFGDVIVRFLAQNEGFGEDPSGYFLTFGQQQFYLDLLINSHYPLHTYFALIPGLGTNVDVQVLINRDRPDKHLIYKLDQKRMSGGRKALTLDQIFRSMDMPVHAKVNP